MSANLYFLSAAEDEKENEKPEAVVLDMLEKEQLSFVRFHPSDNRVAITTTLCRILIYDRDSGKVSALTLEKDQQPAATR